MDIDSLVLNPDGYIPAVIVDDASGRVLTLNYMTPEAVRKTVDEGVVYVFRRSLGRLMKKGETSGHIQAVKEVRVDCEGKSLVVRVEQKVAACHKGYFSCYFRKLDPATGKWKTTDEPVFNPEDVY
jgi:phosphoribosyl-AMP cyclohydrolase